MNKMTNKHHLTLVAMGTSSSVEVGVPRVAMATDALPLQAT